MALEVYGHARPWEATGHAKALIMMIMEIMACNNS